MAKLTLTDISSGYGSVSATNDNNAAIEAAVENTLSRDGTAPNSMGADLDMNSYAINNLPDAVSNQQPITLSQAASLASITTALSRENVGAVLYPTTSTETGQSVTPTNFYYPDGNVLRYGADTTGATDSATAFLNAAKSSSTVVVPKGTYDITNVVIPSETTFLLEEGATLRHNASATDHMIESAFTLRIKGGKIDGNKANRSYSQVQVPVYLTAGSLVLESVHFTNTMFTAFFVDEDPEFVKVESCTFDAMEEHTGSGSTQTMAGLIRVDDGNEAEVMLLHNHVSHGTPGTAGRNPGGFLWDGGTAAAGTGIKRVTAIGNKFLNIGQAAASNFIGCLHGYTTGGEFIGDANEFKQSYWVPLLLQNAKRVSIGSFIITDLVAGVNGVEVQIARSYTPAVEDCDIGRGVITYASGATTGIGWAIIGEASGNDYIPRVTGGPIIVNGGASGGRIEFANDVTLHGMVVENSNAQGIFIDNTSLGTGAPTNAQISLIGGSVKNCGGIGITSAASDVDNLRLTVMGYNFEANTTNHIRGDSCSKLIVMGCDFADTLSNPIRAQSCDQVTIIGNNCAASPVISLTSTTAYNMQGNSWQAEAPATFTASDATPSVRYGKTFLTHTGGLTITDLDDGIAGQEVTIISKGAVVFDTTGTNLSGSSVDLTTASGDVTRWICEDGTNWRLIAFVDASVDNSAGA